MTTAFSTCTTRLAAAVVVGVAACAAAAQQKLHFTYMWHMEQPIYWPDRQVSGEDRYELAWTSIQRKDAGALNPANNLREIFGIDDRRASYQYRMRDAINAIRSQPEAGAQISYSGGLIENISSLGTANQLGYSPGWYNWLREARGWSTTGGAAKPRADIVQFSFHHALLPLLEPSTVRKELQLYKSIYPDAWGASPARSGGLFPSEMAFSMRLIEPLAQEGVQWAIVSGEKLSRACPDFPVIYGSGGINCDPPNKADQLNPAQGGFYFRQTIDRGCSPAEAYPFAFVPRRARYVNPDTGAVSAITVVPASQSLGWKDGYAPMGTSFFDTLQVRNDGSRPQLVVLAHDGDNAWGGGYSYYLEATPNLVASAASQGYVPTVIERYLNDHPVPANDYAHVEDGAWVNADGDFGAPQFLNWLWPLLNSAGQIDIPNGWHEDARNWAVITAAQNRVDTAEQIATRVGGPQPGGLDIRRILHPFAATTNAERAWHYFLGSLNSGYMYYGVSLDMEVKPTIACNEAARLANLVIGDASLDTTPPTIFIPQREVWNPGGTNFGPQHGYKQVVNNGDFWVWTFVADVSGVQGATLKYRIDGDGARPLLGTENETYAGGPGVGAWVEVPMTRRAFPAGNVYNNPEINFFEMPQNIAEQFSARITGVRSKLIDYYVEATDTKGFVKRSPIQHVWVGDGSGAPPPGGGGGAVVVVSPDPPVAGQSVTVTYNPAGRNLASANPVRIHHGINVWQSVPSPDPTMTAGTGTDAGKWLYTLTLPATANQLDAVFNNGAGTWDNNGGADWHFTAVGGVQPFVMDGQLDSGVEAISTVGGKTLYADLRGSLLYVAAPNAGTGGARDAFVFVARQPGALRAAQWGKSGQVSSWDAFLAAENDNTYSGWFDAGVGVATAQARPASGTGVLEGTIDLAAESGGTLPGRVHLAFGQWPTADAQGLIAASQIPATADSNTTLNDVEYIAVDLCRFLPGGCCPVDYNADSSLNPDDLGDFITDYYTAPPLPGPGGYAIGCPGNAVPNDAGYRAAYTADGAGQCTEPFPDNLGDYITAYFTGC
ncbi:MAG: hypothetical protein ACKVS8_11950 [Phycisphaerales bacterium]